MGRKRLHTEEERKEKARQVALKWYYNNREKALARMKNYNKNNPDRIKGYSPEFYQKHKVRLLEWTYAYKERIRVENLLASDKEVVYCELCNRPFAALRWNATKKKHICKEKHDK